MEKHTQSRGKLGFIIAIVAIFVFSGITIYNYRKYKIQKREEITKEDIIPVAVALSEKSHLNRILEQTGNIRPSLEVNVTPKVNGRIIEKIYVEKGGFVQKGDLIATLEDDTIKAQIRESKAALGSARAKLNEVEANLKIIEKDRIRLERLIKENAVSQQAMDQIEARYGATLAGKKLAIAQIERAKASLNLLKIIYKDHQVRAPINGSISARYVDQGSISDTKKSIVRISNEEFVKIVTTVTEQEYPHIKKGMDAEIRVDAFPNKTFKGLISVINPTLDPTTRTGEIEIHVPNKDLTLCSGMFAHIFIHMGDKDALVIPQDALIRPPGTGTYYVYVVEDNVAVMKNIKVGVIQKNYAEIKQGLNVGEQIVVEGQNRLKDGIAVMVIGRKGE